MKKPTPCEIDFRPMTVFRGRPCEKMGKRWGDGLDFAVAKLREELTALGCPDAIVETYHTRADYTLSGRPRSGATPSSPEVQVWFKAGARPVCVPSSRFALWIDNIKAVAMTLERQRLIRDYGCFTIEEQFAAFAALPAGSPASKPTPSASDTEVLPVARLLVNLAQPTDDTIQTILADKDALDRVYRKASKKAHPDKGGSEEIQAAVNRARDFIVNFMGW